MPQDTIADMYTGGIPGYTLIPRYRYESRTALSTEPRACALLDIVVEALWQTVKPLILSSLATDD